MTSDGLTHLIADPALLPLWEALHQRLCSGDQPAGIATLRVPDLSPAGVATLRSLLDDAQRRRRGTSTIALTPTGATIPLRHLATTLGLSPDDLPNLAEQAIGRPIINRARDRQRVTERRHELWDYATHTLDRVPGLVARLRTAGVSNDDETPLRTFIDRLAAALDRIPAHPPISLAKLAHDCAGDPHYFDLGTLNGARLVTAVAELTHQGEPTRPDHIRALLLQAGVIADRLSSTVLLHRVHTIGEGPIDHRLRDSPYPVALTLLDLTLTPPTFAPGQTLTVVENPSVLEAALLLPDPPPLACTSGQLGSVDHTLLQLAVDQNIRVRYSGDLDEAGQRIATQIASLYGADLITVAPDAEELINAAPELLDGRCATDSTAAAQDNRARILYQEHDAVLQRLFDLTTGL